FRISRALEQQEAESALPADLLDRQAALDILDQRSPLHKLVRYTIDRLREYSRILTPAADVEAYHGCMSLPWLARLIGSLAQLARQSRTAEMAELIWSVYREIGGTERLEDATFVLGAALYHARMMGDSFATDLLREIEAIRPALRN